jgi:hypothetical protein
LPSSSTASPSIVVILVAAHGGAGAGIVLNHVEGAGPLRRAIGLGQAGIDDEAIAVLHHQMPPVTELGLLAGAFAKRARVRVGGRGMRVIGAFLAMEIALGIASAAGGGPLPSFDTKLFMLAQAGSAAGAPWGRAKPIRSISCRASSGESSLPMQS